MRLECKLSHRYLKLRRLQFLGLMVMLWSVNTHAQCTLTLMVCDEATMLPLSGARLSVPDLKRNAQANAQGMIKLEGLPKGEYLFVVKQSGYDGLSRTLPACSDSVLHLMLHATVVESREVVVTGASKATELLKMPTAVTTIDRTTLFRTASVNLVDALTSQPGISQIGTGPGISKPVIRGLSYNRVLTMHDGVRQEGQQWGDEHGIEIDEFSADKVEILKGPASIMYGSDAMAGVIHILSAPVVAEGNISGSVHVLNESNNHLRGFSSMYQGNLKGINWMIRGSLRSAANYKNAYDGRVLNSGFQEQDVNGRIGINKQWGYSHLLFSNFNQTLGLVEGERDSLTGSFVLGVKSNDTTVDYRLATTSELNSRTLQLPRQSIRHQKVTFDQNLILGRSRLSFLIALQHNQRKEFAEVLTPEQPGLYLSLYTLTWDIRYYLREMHGWQVTWGAGGLWQRNMNKGVEFLIPDYKQQDAGSFLYFKRRIKNAWNVAGGARFDGRNYRSDALMEDSIQRFQAVNVKFHNVSGTVGLTWSANKHTTLKLNLARGYRAPQAAELCSNGVHEGTFRYEVGNDQLKAETSWQADLGMIYRGDHLSLEVALFRNQIQHFIYLEKLSSVLGGDSLSSGAAFVPVFKFVQGDAVLQGFEVSADIHPHPLDWLHFENTLSMVDARLLNQPSQSTYLPFTPPLRFTSELRADIRKSNPYLRQMYVSASIQAHAAQKHVMLLNNTETTTPGYTLLNMTTGTEIHNKKGRQLGNLLIACNNLTNKAYQSHLSRLKYAPLNPVSGRMGVYNVGRNFCVKLMIPF